MSQVRAITNRVVESMTSLKKNVIPFTGKMYEYSQLVLLNLWIKIKSLPESTSVFLNYYLDYTYAKIDLTLLSAYLTKSPFTVSKEYLISQGNEDVYQYGETPLTTMDYIAKECTLRKTDTVYELGCGRGRTSFWLNHFIGCRVVGIDCVPFFIQEANRVKDKFHLTSIDFVQGDFLKTDFKDATVIYLYGTCLEDEQIKKLVDKFERLPPGTKIITVSFPLTDYTNEPVFEVMKHFPASFTWGVGDVYLQIRK